MDDSVRWLIAGMAVLSYAGLCGGIWRRERRSETAKVADAAALTGTGTPVLVVHATQTGQAEALAWQTARGLHAAGTSVRVLALNDLDIETLRATPRALFVASTYGEGDAPDGAGLFFDRVMGLKAELKNLEYAVLALGDHSYQHFCGFGRQLDAWLAASGATPGFARIEVDSGDPAALAAWRRSLNLSSDASTDLAAFPLAGAPTASAVESTPWRLLRRSHLNPGSEGGPIYLAAFVSPAATVPGSGHEAQSSQHASESPMPSTDWRSGDLARLELASDPGRPRDYSIASIPADGELQLLIRQERHADGSLGAASGLLTSDLGIGQTIDFKLRAHYNFRLDDNARRPILFIGNGTGLAGLRSHLKARAVAGAHANWLVFGERRAAHDYLFRDELEAWQASGVLERLDMVFSRDGDERAYVQHRLLQSALQVTEWLDRGAAIYVCGSLSGMASGVDAALADIAGRTRMNELVATGRYRRDVY